MRAVIYREFGSPDVLKVEHVEKPVPATGEVLVAVRAAAVNMFDWYMVRGKPRVFRLVLGSQPKPLGVDLAGVVEATGTGVTRFKVGDHVFGTGRGKSVRPKTGSFGEDVCVAENMVEAKPRNATFEQAAAGPLAGLTALQGLRNHGLMKKGHNVLVNGASGGIGTFAVQIAKAFGADVTGVCSTRNVDLVGSLGAGRAIDYTKEHFTKTERRYDVMLDLVGNRPLSDCRRAVTARGTYVLVGVSDLGRWFGLARQIKALLLSPFVRQRMRVFVVRHNREDLAVLKELVEAEKVAPVIDRRYELSEVPEALRHQGEGHTQGKIVIAV